MTSYEVKQKTKIDELNLEATVLEHKKTKARVLILPCEDNNKVFSIAFRTTPEKSTGVAHIIEHSVLCGSEKYPCKDPFIELVKGSLNTFLNAMTYPDKTVYPVASCNDKDFENLMSVYLDAVFNPNIYREEKIFRQEGWHYELDSEDGELSYNGVVYNEMKGAYSSADGILERATYKTLFAGHTYGEDSGGDPDIIPELTYEEFIDFHRRYYHPSNSYIYLYGNCDMEKMLDKIDREYLSKYDYLEIDSAVPDGICPEKKQDVEIEYPVSEGEKEDSSAILSYHTVAGGMLDPVKYLALQIIEYLLLEVPGAPLQEALINAGIGENIDGGYQTEIKQPVFSVIAKNTDIGKKDEFVKIIEDCLEGIIKNGFDRQSLEAAVNVFEFRFREADFGSMPKGLIYGLQALESWLYDSDPTMHLKYAPTFAELKALIDKGYYEQLVNDCILNNQYQAVVSLKPVKGLAAKKDNELKEKMRALKAGMSRDEILHIIEQTAALKAYQSEPSSPEDIQKIPLLSREDIGEKIEPYRYEIRNAAGCECIYTDVFTSGIAYIKTVFSMDDIADDDIPYAALLPDILGYIDTEEHSYAELSVLTDLNSGGIGFSVGAYPYVDTEGAKFTFFVNAKTLYDKTGFAFDQISEMLYESKLHDKKRLKDIIAEVKTRVAEILQYSGHRAAFSHAGSYIARDKWFEDRTSGISFYKLLEKLEVDDELCDRLERLSAKLFDPKNMTLNFICDEDGYAACVNAWSENKDKALARYEKLKARAKEQPDTVSKASGESCGCEEKDIAASDINAEHNKEINSEVFTTAGMVNYVARCGSFRNAGYSYNGAINVLKNLLNYDYLWNNIRVLGGAYGCFAVFNKNGTAGFSSYRDPNLTATDDVFKHIPEYAGNFEADEREMMKAIIGAISEMDTPSTPYGYGIKSLVAYYQHNTNEERQKTRNEILSVTPEKIRELKPLLQAIIDSSHLCALGTVAGADSSSEYWDSIRPLIGE